MTTIKVVRKKLGMTQKQLGNLLGMSNTRISEIENGAGGRSETIQQKTHLIAINMLAKHELLDEFQDELKRAKRNGDI